MPGSDDIVQVGEGKVFPSSMYTQIVDTIGYAREYASTMRSQLSDAIEVLGEIIGTYEPEIDLDDVRIQTIARPSFPTRPTFGTLTLDNSWPDGFIPDPAFQEYGLMDVDFVTPSEPNEVDATFSWTAGTYNSEMWSALFGKVHNAIINGTTGLDGATHSAIVSREQEARRLNQSREWRKGLSAVGAKGWNLPGGHATAFLRNLQGEFIQRDQDALNNVLVKDFDVANANMTLFMGNAVDIEKMLRETFDKSEALSLDAAKAAKEYIARFYSENVKLYLAKWEGVKIKFESLKVKVDAISSRNDSEAKIFLSRAQTLEAKVKAITEKNRGLVDSRKAETEIYATEVDAVFKEYQSLVEEVKTNQGAVKMQIDRDIKIEELTVSAYTSKTNVAQAISTAVAQIASQGVASALGAINTSIGSSYGGTEHTSESWSHGDTINSHHSTKEQDK